MPERLVFIVIIAALALTACRGPAAAPASAEPSGTALPLSGQAGEDASGALPQSPSAPAADDRASSIPETASARSDCLAGGDQDTINAVLSGPEAEAVLCPGAVFELRAPVQFSADGQKVYTAGRPDDDSRATLRLADPGLTSAVIMRDQDHAVLSHVRVDGNRPVLGHRQGDALIYAGGSAAGQIIRANRILEPRSWSALHLIEGSPAAPCTEALVEDNQIGPAGLSDETWADGISLACTNSTVRNNLIVDATDGGIVIFGAPGSLISGNTIRAETRTLLGGINMVDYFPYAGDYTRTIVRDNLIDAHGAVIRIGLGMGPRVWVCLPETSEEDTLRGGWVLRNILRGDHMQYGFIIDGVKNWTVLDNVSEAVHGGSPAVDCRGTLASPPAAFQIHLERAQGSFQPEFQAANLELALWAIPSPRPGE